MIWLAAVFVVFVAITARLVLGLCRAAHRDPLSPIRPDAYLPIVFCRECYRVIRHGRAARTAVFALCSQCADVRIAQVNIRLGRLQEPKG